ncbi:MAG: helix-turn-helix domain-containing protein [Faecalibacterium sp.]|nr:helix-turn-helix domain-containing protein [Ruminococcus sp.]MCM1391818.1 helix-turn-helix domain-containing protein [Ruminococcus sp.]MCM1485464.1 helix-turn-helix domain-containing protein [Faecalibacterium sp.]
MTIAERIQSLRKSRGLSQEELAEQIGVSRQAVSKWESDQSMPDIDKIMAISDFFGVSTDYLLKGIEPTIAEEPTVGTAEIEPENKSESQVAVDETPTTKSKADAGIFTIIATTCNFIGVAVFAAIWVSFQSYLAPWIGLILIAIGCSVYWIGQRLDPGKPRSKNIFWLINVWTILVIPFSILPILFSPLLCIF